MSQSQDTNFRVSLTRQTIVVKNRHADTFIWWPKELLACFNNDVLGPISTQDILRWIATLMGRPNAPLYLKLVNIEPYNSSHKAILCRPILKGRGSIPPLLDHDVLSPGDYCVYHQDLQQKAESSPTRLTNTLPVPYPTLESRVCDAKAKFEPSREIDVIPNTLMCEAQEQSQGKCILTGCCVPQLITTQWIFPPSQAYVIPMPHERVVKHDSENFTHIANLVTMRKDIYTLFLQNAFGVDVEDNFKIRVFHASAKSVKLPNQLEIQEADQFTKFFLRKHFRWCLDVYFHGGGVEDEDAFSDYSVKSFLGKADHDLQDPDVKKLTPEDWATPLGRAISEHLLAQGIPVNPAATAAKGGSEERLSGN